MRRLLVVGTLGTVLLLALPLAVTLTGAIGAGASSSTCGTASGSQDVAMTALVVGTRQRASERVLLAAFEAGLVESGMRNLDYGDLDSLGVLQQRPSQGWGTPSQVMNPAYAFGEFYERAIALDQAGYPGSAGQLAQAVQRSAFPLRYDERQADALALLSSLSGDMPVGCQPGTASPAPAGYGTPGPCGLSPSTDYARYLIERTFGVKEIGGCAYSGHVENSDHYPDAHGQAHALDVMVYGNQALGDRLAGWAVANAKALSLKYVIWYREIWTPAKGWHPYQCNGNPTLCHEDHNHLSFLEGT